MPGITSTSLLVLGLIALVVYVTRTKRFDSREPPSISSKIPLIGHVVGFLYHGIGYFSQASAESSSPIITLNMLLNKVYVVTSPELVPAVRRSHRTMSFEPLFVHFAQHVGGLQGRGLELFRGDRGSGQKPLHDTVSSMRPGLLGDGLDQVNEKMVQYLTTSIEELASQKEYPFDLSGWCQQTITAASTDAIYGETNPYRASSVVDAFWTVESNLVSLLMGFTPWLIARKALKAREHIVQALLKYYQEKGYLNASMLVYDRWKAQHDGGATTEDSARLEVLLGLAILSNTVPSCFWFIFDIYSRPALLDELRAEVRQNALTISPEGSYVVDLADIRMKCPLLLSSFQESLRTRSNSLQLRLIFKDTLLDDRYLVKGGSLLFIPSSVIHKCPAAWGKDAMEFDPRRFIAAETDLKQKAPGFLSFGMSPHMCPGRHFATGEVLGLAALLILRFDLSPLSGEWVEPRTNSSSVASSLGTMAEEMRVVAKERPEAEGVKWHFHVTPGKGKHGLVIG